MAQGQDADVTVDTDDLARLVNGVVAAPHEGAVAQDGAFRRTGRTAGEEDGGRLLLVHDGHGSLRLGDALRRKDLHALEFLAQRRKLVTDENGGDIEFHAGTDHGHLREGRREVHGHITGGSDGEEKLDGILAVAVENGDVGSFRKAERLDEGAAAGHTLGQFFVSDGAHLVGQGGHIRVLLPDPLYKLPDGRNIRKAFQFFLGKHVIKIIGHNLFVV